MLRLIGHQTLKNDNRFFIADVFLWWIWLEYNSNLTGGPKVLWKSNFAEINGEGYKGLEWLAEVDFMSSGKIEVMISLCLELEIAK